MMKAFLKTTKGKIILGAAALFIILLILLITKVIGGEEGYRSISVSELSGSVMTENDGKRYEAYKNMRLADGYALTTDIDSYTRMTLDSDKYVKLEEKSRALFEALGSDKQRRTAIRLEEGILTTEITAPLGEDEDYIVNTPNAVLAVRGTFFKAAVRYDTNGDAYTDVYTYGGTVMCKRVMPDGTVVEEEVMITSGYKARVKMDEIITVYVEELIEEEEDCVDPIDIKEVPDGDIVDIYNASAHGHKMFAETAELWQEIAERGIDLNEYRSVYDGGEIPSYDESVSETPQTEAAKEAASEAETSSSEAETNASEASDGENGIPEDHNSAEEAYPAETSVPYVSEEDGGTEASPESSGEAATAAGTGDYTYTEPAEHTHSPYTEISEEEPAVTEVTSVTTEVTASEKTTGTETEPTSAEKTSGTETEPTVYISVTTVSKPTFVPAETTVPEVTSVTGITTVPEVTENTESTSGAQTGSGATVTVPTEPEVHVHNFAEYIPDGNATCTEDGTKTAVCSCGEKDTVIDAGSAGHKEVREVTEASAVSEGRIFIYCSVCGETVADEVIPRLPIYIDDGNLVISETGFSQGGGEEIPYTGDYNISQRSSTPAASTITVVSGTHNISFNGIDTSTASDTFTVEKGAAVAISGGSKENRLSASGANCYGLYSSGGSAVIKGGIFNFSGSGGIFGTAESVFSVSGGYISANGSSDGIRTSGTFSVSGGNVSAYGGDNGIWNNGGFTVNGGSLSAEGGSKDIKTYSDIKVTGGSVRAVRNEISGAFINSIGDELECEAFDVFPSETVRTFENSKGEKYVYGLAPEDKASDGYYYVWKPIDFTPAFDGTVYMDDGSVTVTAEGIEQGGKVFDWTEDIVISQKDRSTAFDAKITVESGTHNITLDGVNINSSKGSCAEISSGASVSLSGSFKENIIASAQERAVNNSGTLRIDSGAFKLSGGYCGLYNYSRAAVNGGRISVSGGVCDIFNEESGTLTVSGGSVKPENSAVGGKLTNTSGDELECKVYSEYTGNLTFEDGGGNEYVYKLDVSDSIDGGYYVWQPKGFVPDGVEVNEENFPDEVFRNYVSENFDKDKNGYLSEEEIAEAERIDTDMQVCSLQGIEYFTALTWLNCSGAQITSLDVSNNTALTMLDISSTQISSIDLSSNAALEYLKCYNTLITSLDLSKNTNLTGLDCRYDPITSLDVSNNTALEALYCSDTKIPCADLTNTSVTTFEADGCEHPITVTNGKFDTKTIDGFDFTRVSDLQGAVMDENGVLSRITKETITYTYDCGRGKSETFALITGIVPVQGVAVNEENFPDTVFREYVSENFDNDKNGYLSEEEIAEAKKIKIRGKGTSPSEDGGVTSLKGIEYLTALEDLDCWYNINITEIDVSNNTALTHLACSNTQITSLDVSKNTALTYLSCGDTRITSLDVSNNTALTSLSCYNNSITSLDVSSNTALTDLHCANTQITSLDLSKNTALDSLNCYNNQIKELNVSNNTDLNYLDCRDTIITGIDVSKNTALEYLYCQNTQITSLDLSSNRSLSVLDCSGCCLAYVDISNNLQNILSTNFYASDNKHSITVVNGTFDTKTIDGFDLDRVSGLAGASKGENGVINGIKEGTKITYRYDCGWDRSAIFTLVPDENSTFEPEEAPFDGTIYMDDGSVTITSTGFTQGNSPEETLWTGDYVITQRNSSEEITAYIDVTGTHNITFDGLNLCYYGMVVELDGNITVNGTSNKNTFVCRKIDGLESHGIIYTGLYCEGDIVFESGIIETDSMDYSIYVNKYSGGSHPIIDGASITALNKVFINGSSDTLTLNSGTLNIRNISGVIASTGNGTMYVNGGLVTIDSDRYIVGKYGVIMGGSMCFVPNTNTNGKITNAFGDELECVVYDTFPSETERTFTNSYGSTYVYKLNEADHADDGKYYVWKPKAPFDGTLDLSAGAVTITSEGFVQNGVTTPWTGDYTVSGGSSSAITVESGRHTIILDEANISANGGGLTIAEGAEVTLSGSGTVGGISVSGKLTAEDCDIVSTGQYGIYVSAGGTVSIALGSLDLSGSNSGIFCAGNLEISGGSVSAEGGSYGIMNGSNGSVTVSGGSVSISGGTDDIYSSGEFAVTGGSVRVTNDTVIGSIVNADGAELECVVFDVFPSTAERTFTNPDGSEYVYLLNEGDRAADGKYYVWKPKAVPTGVEVSEENFPDTVFREYVSDNFDKDSDGWLSEEEIAGATHVDVRGDYRTGSGVTSLKGIDYLTAVETLYCFDNTNLIELDLSNNTALTNLSCGSTSITSLNVSNNTKLKSLSCSNTQITRLDLSSNTELEWLICNNTPITYLNLKNNVALIGLECFKTQLTNLDLSGCTELKSLKCHDTLLKELDLNNNTLLYTLYCGNTQITTLDLSQNIELNHLYCIGTPLTNLDLSKNKSLAILEAGGCCLAYVDISNNPIANGSFNVAGNKHPITVINGKFDTKTIAGFDHTRASGCDIMDANGVISGITEGTKITYTYDCGQGKSATFTLVPDDNSTFDAGVEVNAENFPDTGFRDYVSSNFDTDSDGYLSEEEIAGAVNIDLSFAEVSSLKGIELFNKLEVLKCGYNPGLLSLDVSKNTALTELWYSETKIKSIDLSQNTALTKLWCYDTPTTSLDLSNNTALTYLDCTNTKITSLDLSQNTALKTLNCENSKITSLDVSNNTALNALYCRNTQITSLNVSNNTELTSLDCSETAISSLDVSKNTVLKSLYCYSTQITSLDVSKNTALTSLSCRDTQITRLDVSNNTALEKLYCYKTQIPFVDISNTSVTDFAASGCKYMIPVCVSFDAMSNINFSGFNPYNVSDVQGADFYTVSGIFDNFTSNTVTYKYDCGKGFSETFTLEIVGELMLNEAAEDEDGAEDEDISEDEDGSEDEEISEDEDGTENEDSTEAEDAPAEDDSEEIEGGDVPADDPEQGADIEAVPDGSEAEEIPPEKEETEESGGDDSAEPEQSISDMLLEAAVVTAAAAAANMVDITVFTADIVIYLISILIKLWR